MRILVVEDDEYVARTLKILLINYGYAVDATSTGTDGLQMADAFEYDLIILDVILPDLDGISLCQRLRAKGYQVPILLLTGQGGGHQKAVALNAGADDYVVKPFHPEELIARVQALLRRGRVTAQPIMEWGELRLEPGSHMVTFKDQTLVLTPKEYAILELFMRHNQRIFAANTILDRVWTAEETPGEETVRGHIKELRKKLKAVGAPADFIETVYRVGYRLKPLVLAELPTEAEALPHSSETTVQAVSGSSASQSSKTLTKIMVVVHNLEQLMFLQTLLEAESFQTLPVPDPSQFWSILEAEVPDLLILDAGISNIEILSGVDVSINECANSHEFANAKLINTQLRDTNKLVNSIKLCQYLRQTPRWETLPVLFLLPSHDVELIKQIFAAGADDFVSQPIVGPELIARVTSYFKQV